MKFNESLPLSFSICFDNLVVLFWLGHRSQITEDIMTDQQLLIRHRKVMIQARLMQSLSIHNLCGEFHVSHTTFYKWFNLYLVGGDLRLANKPRCVGKRPRQISKNMEMAILDFSEKHPAAGPQTISDALRRNSILVGKTVDDSNCKAAYNTLKSHKLNHKKFRYLKAQNTNILTKNTYQRELDSSRKKSIKTKAPGYLLNMDTLLYGNH